MGALAAGPAARGAASAASSASCSTRPTGDEEIEHALAAQSQEIELRATELAETVADLERREERTYELRVAVEQMLRRGSAELDERHAELSELAGRLADRDRSVADAEEASPSAAASSARSSYAAPAGRAPRRDDDRHETELARREEELRNARSVASSSTRSVTLRPRDRPRRALRRGRIAPGPVAETLEVVEREQRALAEREAAVQEREQQAQELELRERTLTSSAAELETLEQSLAADRSAIETQREELRQAVVAVSRGLGLATGDRGEGSSPRYVALVPGERYRLVEREDGPPSRRRTDRRR